MFYQKSIQDILKECESSLEGLYDFQVKKHSAKYWKSIPFSNDSDLYFFSSFLFPYSSKKIFSIK